MSGHLSSACMSAPKTVCRVCNQEGHIAKNCPQSAVDPTQKSCFICRGPHLQRNCPQNSGYGAVNPQSNVCYHCGQYGHWARQCPSYAGTTAPMQCYNCRGPHLQRNCPNLAG